MGISIDGISTGLDTTALIDTLLVNLTIPMDLMEENLSETEDIKAEFTELSGLLSTMQEALEDMDTASEFTSATATESDAYTATLDSDARVGSYDVEVTALAKSNVFTGPTTADPDGAGTATEGTYTISVGGVDTDITIDATNNTLTELADAINDVDGVSAYLVESGSGQQLVVRSDDTGLDNAVSIAEPGAEFTEVQAASDAAVTIDGVSVTSATNTVSDVVPGLTLSLTATTSGAETLTISRDTEAMTERITAFVDAYNAVLQKVDAQSAYDAESGIDGAFTGESSIRRIMRTLRSSIVQDLSVSGAYSTLTEVGITTNDTSGKLEIDDDVLESALASNHADVEALFVGADGFAAKVADTIDVIVDPIDGTLESRIDSLDAKIEDLEDQIETYELRVEKQEARIRAQFNAMEVTVGKLNSISSLLETYFSTDTSSS